jgi:nucleoside-diphosphate-sugar epimerase
MSDRVLVTGATGFVAGHCVRELLDNGYAVRATVRNPSATEKFAHLRELGGDLEFVAADLNSDDGWAAAVDGCAYVMHVASPFPSEMPDDENELIRPAVDGTLRVLRAAAASGTVRRVVLTSSIAAIVAGHDRADQTVRTEADWSDVDNAPAYQKSKTLAEKAAWDYVATLSGEQRFELVVVNPGMVLGPLQHASAGTSVEILRRLLAREVPGSPRIGFAAVDVRDLAVAHRLAMQVPEAAGNRYICAGPDMWLQEMAQVMAREFNGRGFRVPTGRIPYWLVWVLARFDKTVRNALYFVGRRETVSADKVRHDLGWTMRPVRDTVVDTANSLIEYGICTPRGRARQERPVVLAGER